MLRTVIYIRKSSEEKDRQAQSLERQYSDIMSFLERHNATVDYPERLEIKDPERDIIRESWSAKKPGREKFNEMIKRIEKWYYDVLLCTEPSRLSRNPIDTGILIHMMDENHLQYIKTLTSSYSSDSSAEKFTLGLFLSISKYENDQRGTNTSSGMQNVKLKWGTTNLANMGYRNSGDTKWQKRVIPDEENFTILQDAWKKLITWNYKITELHEEVVSRWFTRITAYKNGIKRDVPSLSAFRGAFRNEYYMGLIGSKGEFIQGNHDPMVTREEFEKVQVVLQKSGYKHSKAIENVSYGNLLKEILICGKTNKAVYVDVKKRYTCPTSGCGYRYGSATWPKACPQCGKLYKESEYKIEIRKYYSIKKAKHTYYDEKSKTMKEASNFDAKFIEALVDAELKKVQISEGLFQIFRRQLYTLWLEKTGENKKKITKKRGKIEELEEKQRKLQASLITDSPDDKERKRIEGSISDNDSEIQSLETDIRDLREWEGEEFEKVWQSLNVLLQAKSIFNAEKETGKIDFEPKRRLVLSLFSNLKFIDGKIIPEWKEPFATIVNSGILTKKKSQTKSEISDSNVIWLPE